MPVFGEGEGQFFSFSIRSITNISKNNKIRIKVYSYFNHFSDFLISVLYGKASAECTTKKKVPAYNTVCSKKHKLYFLTPMYLGLKVKS
jgi:murein endopeptidase